MKKREMQITKQNKQQTSRVRNDEHEESQLKIFDCTG